MELTGIYLALLLGAALAVLMVPFLVAGVARREQPPPQTLSEVRQRLARLQGR